MEEAIVGAELKKMTELEINSNSIDKKDRQAEKKKIIFETFLRLEEIIRSQRQASIIIT